MIGGVDARSESVARARISLTDACSNLDDAVRTLSEDNRDETVMANPNLVTLLLRVVAARRYLQDAERRPSEGPPASLR
jgi:hypothetical protein